VRSVTLKFPLKFPLKITPRRLDKLLAMLYSYRVMPTPKLELAAKYLTTTQAHKRLGLSRFQLNLRIARGIFPPPTYVDNAGPQSVRYFDENWIRIARAILKSSAKKE